MISNCPLRCHHLDRKDELEAIKFNRQLNGGPAKKREELEDVIKKAKEKLEAFDKGQVKLDRWLRLLEDSLIHHWIDKPEQYIKEWNEKNPES